MKFALISGHKIALDDISHVHINQPINDITLLTR